MNPCTDCQPFSKNVNVEFFFLDPGTSPSNCDKLNKFSIINRIKKSIEPIHDESRKVEIYNGFYKNLKTNQLTFRASLHIKSTKQSEIKVADFNGEQLKFEIHKMKISSII